MTRAMPFRTASEASVSFSAPSLTFGDVTVMPGEPALGWDYLTPVSVSATCSINAAPLLAETGLTDLASVSAVMQVDCPQTGHRMTSLIPAQDVTDAGGALFIDVPANTIAGSLEVRLALCLTQPLEPGPSMAPHQRGSRIYQGKRAHRFYLEGDGSSFPSEAYDFGPAGLPPEAPWHLSMGALSLDEPFMSCVRLYVNTAHPAASKLLAGRGIEHSVLFHGIIEQMLDAAADHDLSSSEEWEEDSLGAVLKSLSRTYLNMSLEDAVSALRSDRANTLTRLRASAALLLASKGPKS